MWKRVIMVLTVVVCATEIYAQVSLQAYRDSVYVFSTEIIISEEKLSQSYSTMKRRRTDFYPSLSAQTTYQLGFRRFGEEKLWNFALVPQISQRILGGGVRAMYQQAQADVRAGFYNAQYVKTEMLYQADYAYWALSAMGLYRGAVEEYVEIIGSLAQIVRERYAEGYVAKSELLQVEARLSEAKFALIESQNNYDVALHRFNNLRGIYEPEEVQLSESILDSIEMPQRVAFEEIVEMRYDLQSAKERIRSAEFGVGAVQAQYLPKVELSVSGSWRTYSPNIASKTYLDGALMLGINVPIFHWGERRKAVAAARSEVRIAKNMWQQAKDDMQQEEADGWSELQNSLSQMRSSLRNLEIAGENLQISTYSYNEGRATLLEVLQAQISWMQIYTNAITARFNYAVAVSAYRFITATY
jgi:outer membrane protein TolC